MAQGSRSIVQQHHSFGASMLALIAASFLAGPAGAQGTLLHGKVFTTYVSTLDQSWPNIPIASLESMIAHDAFGNDGIAHGTLSIPGGRAILSPHACSGGALGFGFGGQATASANVANVIDYKIVSATLPDGAPDTVLFNWALASRVTAVGKDMVGANTGANALASFQLAIAPDYNVQVNKAGSISRSYGTSGMNKIIGGNSNAESDSAHFTFPMQVGQIIRVTINCDAGANSSVEIGQTDGDVQLAAVWGLTSKDPNASVVSANDLILPAPPASSATPADAYAALPPKDGSLPCFQFSQQPEDVSLCGTTSASFTSGATGGGGPYTYQWRKDGVPIDLQTNPTAQNPTLSLSNVTTGDAGSYDVVIYDHCGNRTSNPATLTVCATGVDGTPVGARLAPARPAPFRASTTIGFDLVAAGDATLEIFDVRGAHVRTLASGWQQAGHTDVTWHGDNETGRHVPAGVYMVRFTANGVDDSERVVRMP